MAESNSEENRLSPADSAAHHIITAAPQRLRKPEIALVCGSGLSDLDALVDPLDRFEISYEQIPYMHATSVPGHAGKLVLGIHQCSRRVICVWLGRLHFYEGYSMDDVTFPVRVIASLGVNTLIVTNAAGALNSLYNVGDLVLFSDHINLAGMAGWHPLRGQDPGALNERFVALSDVYDLSLRASAFEAWAKIGGDGKYRLLEGIYAYVCGPSYETRAECRMLSLLGADLVGMSTVPEVIVARQCALKILALSLVTNKTVSEPGPNAAGRTGSVTVALQSMMTTGKANHLEVLSVGSKAANSIKRLIDGLLMDIPRKDGSAQGSTL